MLFLSRVTLGLIGAAMAVNAALAAADAVPTFSVDASCRAAAQEAASPNYLSVCRNTEQKAHDETQRQWPQLNAADKAQCVQAATVGGTPTYTELLTCLEMARDVRNPPGRSQPATIGQGVK